MNVLLRTGGRVLSASILIVCLPTIAAAQSISLKTVPVAAGDQFLIFPSRNLGMGGVSIALDDPLLDPFINPAKGTRIKGARLFATPTFYSVSGQGGAGRTLPLAALFGSDEWFGGVSLSVQQLESAERRPSFGWVRGWDSAQLLSERSANNTYAFGLFGTKLPRSGVSIAGSVLWAGLDAVDGVDLLYVNSERIQQFGHMVDYRIGALVELDGERSLEAVLLHSRLNMTHNVTFLDRRFDEETQRWLSEERRERNLDRTNTWGLHLSYVQPLRPPGLRMGGILTVNWKTHPKLPNYDIVPIEPEPSPDPVVIPKDPGDSWAFNVGLGISRSRGSLTYGVDLIYEPAWSSTWAEAETPVVDYRGRIIPEGGKTIENEFRFSNACVRTGLRVEGERGEFQFGLQARSVHYRLEQYDNVEGLGRRQKEDWMEWTPSWGGGLKFDELQVRYTGRLTTGTGRLDTWRRNRLDSRLRTADVLVAPEGPLTLRDVHVFTHQFSVIVPID